MPSFLATAHSYQPGATGLPARCFTSPEMFDQELERLFCEHWVCLGHVAALSAPGDFLTTAWGSESVLVLRDHDGALRAFHNVCRHRGARLCVAESGRLGPTIQCLYHAWTYGLDGALLGAPHMDEVTGFARADYPLHQVALEHCDGLLFINLAAEPPPLAESLAPLPGKFARWNLPLLRRARRLEYTVAANWKLLFENFNECYHCPLVHPGLAKLTPFDSSENDLAEGPILGGFMALAPGRSSLTHSGNRCGALARDLPADDQRRVYFYSIFPNLLLSLHPDYVLLHTVWPQATNRTLVRCDWLFHPDSFEASDFNPDEAVAFWDEVNRQDWRVCELSQLGISSRAYRPGPYSPRESLTAAWDRQYLRAMGE